MNRYIKQLLLGFSAVVLIGSVGAQSYYTHKIAERLDTGPQPLTGSGYSISQDNDFYDPFLAMQTDIERMQSTMNELFNSSLPTIIGDYDFRNSSRIQFKDQDKDYVVEARMPGAQENDIDVNLNGRLLTLSSHLQKTSEQQDSEQHRYRQEQWSSSFQQAYTLPGPVDASGMKTDFKEGVLTITIPKA